jgi:hypothetical protein
MKVLFTPISIGVGLAAGLVANKIFDQVWGLFDDQEPPESEHLNISIPKMLIAAAVQGAIFRTVKEIADHGLRHGFKELTGTWPGEEDPEPA